MKSDRGLMALDLCNDGVHEVKSEGGYSLPARGHMIDTKHFNATVAECLGTNFIRASGASDAGKEYIDLFNAPWQAYMRALDSTTGEKVWEANPVRSNRYSAGLLDCRGDRFRVEALRPGHGTYSGNCQQFLAIANVFAFGLQEINP